jgi:DNA-binding IclR family transcriptional regulator
MKKPKGEYAIQTVVNAMRLLEEFRDEETLGVTELSRRLALHKNNVFRLLATLDEQGYIEQSEDTERYRLGVKALELGRSFARSRTLLRCAQSVLEDLADGTRESAHVAVLRDFAVVHVAGAQTERPIMTGLRLGERLPAYCTALGKSLLGCSPEEVRQAYDRDVVSGGTLQARTDATITDPHKLFEELRTVGGRGFALDLEECEEGLCCAAGPVFDSEGQVIAAISVSAPRFRVTEDRMLSELAPRVVASAERLSHDLGYGA